MSEQSYIKIAFVRIIIAKINNSTPNGRNWRCAAKHKDIGNLRNQLYPNHCDCSNRHYRTDTSTDDRIVSKHEDVFYLNRGYHQWKIHYITFLLVCTLHHFKMSNIVTVTKLVLKKTSKTGLRRIIKTHILNFKALSVLNVVLK